MNPSRPSWRQLARIHRGLRHLARSERHGALSALIVDSLGALRGEGDAAQASTELRARVHRLQSLAAALRRRRPRGELEALLDESERELGRLLDAMGDEEGPEAAGGAPPPGLSPG